MSDRRYHVTPTTPKEGALVLGVVIHQLAWERLERDGVPTRYGISHLGWAVRDEPEQKGDEE